MVDGVVFDNFLITSDQSIAKQYADQIWYPKSVLESKAISSASESVVDAIVRATKDRPWLWAVYLVAILLPLILLFVFCWPKKSTKTSKADALHKKTDQSEADTTEQQVLTRNDDEEEDEEPEEIEITERKTTRTVTTATGRDALETKDDEEVAVEVRRFPFVLLDHSSHFSFQTTPTVEESDPVTSSPSASNKARRRPRKE